MTSMASWKVRGVVPDSDDEDSLDSESNASEADTEQRHRSRSNDRLEHGEITRNEYAASSEHDSAEKSITQDNRATEHEHTAGDVDASSTGFLKPNADDRLLPSSSPALQQKFQAPRSLCYLGHDLTDSEDETTGSTQDLPALPSVDEISKTYVQLTSTVSSPLSSIPGSQQDRTSVSPCTISLEAESHSSQRVQPTSNDDDATIQEPANLYKRALRERAPIQLHPYAMEQEKYRRSLKARGMTPMRLAQTQDESQRENNFPSSDMTSQDLESQELNQEAEESQPMDFSWDSITLPPIQNNESQLSGSQKSGDSASIDDDEFPDVSELLRWQQQNSRMEVTRRIKSYSSKLKRAQLSRIQTQSAKSTKPVPKSNEVFGVPASPPTTSSPSITMTRSGHATVSRAPSNSPEGPLPGRSDRDTFKLQSTQDLPTPATSSIKPVSEPMFLESDLDDDPFASELNDSASSSSSPSSSDESIQIRKVSKKIRGVLPASHLRLDQQLKRLKPSVRSKRSGNTVSPEKSAVRRGIALSKTSGTTSLARSLMNNGLPLLSDDSVDEDSDPNGQMMEEHSAGDLESIFAGSRMGYAEEEDRVDLMLPSLKRQRHFNTIKRKKMRVGSASIPRGNSHQPKISQHLVRKASSKSHTSHRAPNGKGPGRTDQRASIRKRKLKPPRLSILDVVDLASGSDAKVPQFMKVAARTARSKLDRGRQSPSKKFIRLAVREDTFDAQSVLEDWRSGRIMPRILGASVVGSDITSRSPLGRIADNRQTRLQPPISKVKPRFQSMGTSYGRTDIPRQLVVSRRTQMSIRDYTSNQPPVLQRPNSTHDPDPRDAKAEHHLPQRRVANPRHRAPQSRPAQLEESEVASSRQNVGAAFKIAKKSLDGFFRLHKKRPVNLQLNRFLFDADVVPPPPRTALFLEPETIDPKSGTQEPMMALPKPRKRLPQRIDAGAVRYRQPSEPLVLHALPSANFQASTGQENKLIGLAKFGTRYPIDFDVFPLQSGIFFHESTFIGSGRLAGAVKDPAATLFLASRGQISFRLGDKEFRWGQWNEDVSSEIGLFFDCLIELLFQCPRNEDSSDPTKYVSVEFLIDYVQHYICFISSESQHSFLLRALETLQDFSSRVRENGPQSNEKKTRNCIDTMAGCTVLILQLLRISRAAQAALTSQFEDLLKSVASLCVELLVHQGFGSIRKLYDDLQYLSFRERGIRSDQYIAQSWVMILRVLDEARISKWSFWDITNMALMEGDANIPSDARPMEQIWHSMYSLLPLFDFDEFGVVVSGLRHRLPFDNWAIPQGMLRRVFALYTTSPKQYPGFNDYCRALLCRCHFLMREWGWWKCSGMIGTVFDFFASHKLEHLRNEEVYKSPRFLEELDAQPVLDAEPEDRCFHVFLKIVGLAIQYLHQAQDERSIRNLVARLLPNHDRQYPKDEKIIQRHLAALRNHHDLLCTLYWASPPDLRPSLSLLQDLVIPDRSHKEACLINLRALDNLARYIFTSPADEAAIYQQFTLWELAFFEKLLYEYLHTSSSFHKQAELLTASHKQPITETQLQKFMEPYRQATKAILETLLSKLQDKVSNAKDAGATLSCLNPELLTKILNSGIFGIYRDVEQSLFESAIDTLCKYMTRVNNLHPFRSQQLSTYPTGADSQGSFDFANVDIERQMMIYPLHEVILPNFALITRDILECRLYQLSEPSFMEALVCCWARLVVFVTEEKFALRDFIVDGTNSIFENRQRHARTNKYWPLFLSELLKEKDFNDFNVSGFDLGTEWMQVVTSNPQSLVYEHYLSNQLCRNGYYLLEGDHFGLCDWRPAQDEWPDRHLSMFQIALNSMREIKVDPNYRGFTNHTQLSEKETQGIFSTALKNTMDSMQRQLNSMIPRSADHNKYVNFCQDAVSYLRGYTSNIRPITDFFLLHSDHYWPKSDDPHLYAAGILSYSLRLHEAKAPLELFHYLYSGWKNDHLHSRGKSHITCVLKGMKSWAFTEFMLAHFVPATVLAGFNTTGGCVLAKTYLPALAKRTPHFLQKDGPEGLSTFTHLINILKISINSIKVLLTNSRLHPSQFGVDDGLYIGHEEIISATLHFWISIQPALFEYVEARPIEMAILEKVITFLIDIISDLASSLTFHEDFGAWTTKQLEVTPGEYVDRFAAALQDDIEKHWSMSRGSSWAHDVSMVKITTGAREDGVIMLPLARGVPTFDKVLELWKSSNGGIDKESLDRRHKTTGKALGFPVWMMDSHVTRFPGVFRGFF